MPKEKTQVLHHAIVAHCYRDIANTTASCWLCQQHLTEEWYKPQVPFFLVVFSQGRSAEWLWRSISNLRVCVTLSAYRHPVPALYYSSFSPSRFPLTYSNPVGDKVFFFFSLCHQKESLCVSEGRGWGEAEWHVVAKWRKGGKDTGSLGNCRLWPSSDAPHHSGIPPKTQGNNSSDSLKYSPLISPFKWNGNLKWLTYKMRCLKISVSSEFDYLSLWHWMTIIREGHLISSIKFQHLLENKCVFVLLVWKHPLTMEKKSCTNVYQFISF